MLTEMQIAQRSDPRVGVISCHVFCMAWLKAPQRSFVNFISTSRRSEDNCNLWGLTRTLFTHDPCFKKKQRKSQKRREKKGDELLNSSVTCSKARGSFRMLVVEN